jgi:hypothetical protein
MLEIEQMINKWENVVLKKYRWTFIRLYKAKGNLPAKMKRENIDTKEKKTSKMCKII